jgi:uncharacterized protein YgiB involved in biofilm formation
MTPRARFILLVALLGIASRAPGQDLQRGLRNYQEIMAGRKKLDQLTPQEQQEVLAVFRRVRAAQNKNGKSAECQEAQERAESAASELADRARKLRNCAESRDYTDDCSTEFRRVKNAHSDYESAVSEIGSSCN